MKSVLIVIIFCTQLSGLSEITRFYQIPLFALLYTLRVIGTFGEGQLVYFLNFKNNCLGQQVNIQFLQSVGPFSVA